MINPAGELKAAAAAARDGLGTRTRGCGVKGYDPELVDQERAERARQREAPRPHLRHRYFGSDGHRRAKRKDRPSDPQTRSPVMHWLIVNGELMLYGYVGENDWDEPGFTAIATCSMPSAT
jgi:hypothetical protein